MTVVTVLTASVLVLFGGRKVTVLRISFIDVGQGESILMENPSGTVYLIDGGSTSVNQVGKYRIVGAVKYYGISDIDYVIITHPDTDHISAVEELLNDMKSPVPGNGGNEGTGNKKNSTMGIAIHHILIPTVQGNNNYNMLCELAREKGVEIINLHAGMVMTDGELAMKCLHPAIGYTSESVNDHSAVLDISYGSFTALMTGDLEEDGENILLNDNVLNKGGYDILKVSHHGSKYSSTEGFLEAVSPKAAVISAGENNSYGHPHKETLDRLSHAGAEIFVTAQSGEIIVEAHKNGNFSVQTKLPAGIRRSYQLP